MENNKLPGQTDTNAPFDKRPFLAVDFQGRAKIKGEKKEKPTLIAKFIPGLNRQAEDIAHEIREEIRHNLPVGLDVQVDISFSLGSVSWDGIANVLDVAGKFVDGIDFTKIAISVIRFAINKVIRKRIEPQYQIVKLDTAVTKRKIQDSEYPVTRFLWWCGGTSKDILRDSTFSEKAKYVSMGGVVLTTGVLACASGGYAMYTVFESNNSAAVIGLLFGLVWGLIIFNLDRYIVTSMKKERGADGRQALRAELKPAWARFLVALLLGLTISVPLELRLFRPEIEAQMKFSEDVKLHSKGDELNKRYAGRVSELSDRIDRISQEITKKEQQVNDLREAFYQEMDRRGGTRIYGYGPVAKRKEAEFQKVENERKLEIDLLSTQKKQLTNEIVQIDNQKKLSLQEYQKSLGQGLLERITALSDLSRAHRVVYITTIFLALLFIFFEIAPVLVKILSKFGPYDAKLDLREEAEVSRAKNKRKSVIQIDEKHYENMTKAEIAVEETVHDESIEARKGQIIQEYRHWVSQRTNGQTVSFRDFLRSIADSYYGERDYLQ